MATRTELGFIQIEWKYMRNNSRSIEVNNTFDSITLVESETIAL